MHVGTMLLQKSVPSWHCLTRTMLLCREGSISATLCLSNSMHEVIKTASDGAHIPPSVMHSAQDAIAAIYYLLQLHGSFMAESGAAGHAAVCAAAEAMITSLKVRVSSNIVKSIDHHCFVSIQATRVQKSGVYLVVLSTNWGCVYIQYCIGLCCMSSFLDHQVK